MLAPGRLPAKQPAIARMQVVENGKVKRAERPHVPLQYLPGL